jgi:hypothetical protein
VIRIEESLPLQTVRRPSSTYIDLCKLTLLHLNVRLEDSVKEIVTSKTTVTLFDKSERNVQTFSSPVRQFQ